MELTKGGGVYLCEIYREECTLPTVTVEGVIYGLGKFWPEIGLFGA